MLSHQTMFQKLKNLLEISRESFDRQMEKLRAFDDVPMPKYEILIMNRKGRNFNSQKFYTMKDAMNYVSPNYLYDTENEYYLLDIMNPRHGIIKLNKLNYVKSLFATIEQLDEFEGSENYFFGIINSLTDIDAFNFLTTISSSLKPFIFFSIFASF